MERLESTGVGRAVISALVVILVASTAISSLGDVPLRRSLLRRDQAILDVTGLDQRWDLFAPNPRRRAIDVRARLLYPDGHAETWTLPRSPTVFGAYRDHRWRKWMDNGSHGAAQSPLWGWLARWLLATRRHAGRAPVSVTVVGRWRDLRPPGASGPDRGRWRRLVLYRTGST